MKKKVDKKLERKQFTIQEIWDAMKGNVQRNRKKYHRPTKHKNCDKDPLS